MDDVAPTAEPLNDIGLALLVGADRLFSVSLCAKLGEEHILLQVETPLAQFEHILWHSL